MVVVHDVVVRDHDFDYAYEEACEATTKASEESVVWAGWAL